MKDMRNAILPSDLENLAKPEVRLSREQQIAVELVCDRSNTIVGVTGGAGTGKTLVLGTAYRELRSKGCRVVLAAPTGRAAKRIQELTRIQAKTIHRLLEFPQPDEMTKDDPEEPRRNMQRPLDEHVVIVDESSMISPTLYRQLMNALGKGTVVRFFGDNNQLPPVEQGTPPFIEVLRKYPMVELSFNYRSEDAIVNNAQRILRGYLPQKNDQFVILWSDDPVRMMLDFVKGERIFGGDTHQIIMPTRRGKYGTIRVNPSLQTRFNPRGPMLKLDRFDDADHPLGVRDGDKILWIKNDYKLELFNGEIGVIDGLDTDSGDFTLRTSDRSVLVPARLKTYSTWHGTVIDYDPRKQVELGYAITTHKAQGSEFDTVIYCICRGQFYLLNRRNFYTAVTRAKRQVIIITDRTGLAMAMKPHQV